MHAQVAEQNCVNSMERMATAQTDNINVTIYDLPGAGSSAAAGKLLTAAD